MLRKLQSEDKECSWTEKRKNTADGPASFRDGASARIINIKYIFLMKIVNLGTMPSVVNCYMAQLRDVNYQKIARSSGATWSASAMLWLMS